MKCCREGCVVRATARRATLVANPYSMTDAAPPSPDATWQLDSASGPCLLSAGELKGLKLLGRGKVRDLYQVDDERLLVVSTDRLSAFDVIMKNGVPGKGKILNQLTVFWLRHLERAAHRVTVARAGGCVRGNDWDVHKCVRAPRDDASRRARPRPRSIAREERSGRMMMEKT